MHWVLHYGDPPRHSCGGAGETMNVDDLRIVEFWKRSRKGKKKFLLTRRRRLEVVLEEP